MAVTGAFTGALGGLVIPGTGALGALVVPATGALGGLVIPGTGALGALGPWVAFSTRLARV